MKTFLLTFLFMIGLTVVHGQEKMQFSEGMSISKMKLKIRLQDMVLAVSLSTIY